MPIVSEASLLSHCVEHGLKRIDAVVLAHIAFFEQLEGGVEIAGIQWRFRSVAEIGAATAYSVRNVTRALLNLESLDLIERRVIWDPRHSGRRVGAYRLTKASRRLFAEVSQRQPSLPYRNRREGVHDNANESVSTSSIRLSRMRQSGVNMYRGQNNEQDMELVTLGQEHEERVFEFLSGEKPKKGNAHFYFAGYVEAMMKHPPGSPKVIKAFWDCLEDALNSERQESLEPLDPVVSRQVGDFLHIFRKKHNAWLSPVEHGAIALWAYLNWYAFAGLVGSLKSKWPDGRRMNSWHLAKHGMLIVDHFLKEKNDKEASQSKSIARKNDDF